MDPVTMMAGGAIFSGLGGILGGAFNKQKAPKMAPAINLGKEVGNALSINEANLPRAQNLATRVNRYNQGQLTSLLEQAMPGIGRVREQLMGQLQEDLTTRGLPKAVEENLRRKAAEMGVSRGTQGGFNQFKLLQDFGFNMIDWERARRAQALQTISTLQGVSPRANPMSPMSSLVTSQQALRTAENNQSNLQAYYNAQAAAHNANRANRAQMISGAFGAVGGAMTGVAGMQHSQNLMNQFTGTRPGVGAPINGIPSYHSF